MSFLEPIIRELSQKFGLGAHAGALAMEALRTITNERSGGLAAFINRFQTAGLGDLVASWIGKGENQSIEPGQLDTALGGDFISTIASKVGLPASTAGAALAFIVPKLIDKLTPDGKVPSVLPTEVSALLSGGAPRGAVAADAGADRPQHRLRRRGNGREQVRRRLAAQAAPALGAASPRPARLLGLRPRRRADRRGTSVPSATATAPSASAPAATATGQAKPDAAVDGEPVAARLAERRRPDPLLRHRSRRAVEKPRSSTP